MNLAFRATDFVYLLPILATFGWGCLVLFTSALSSGKSPRLGGMTAVGIVIALGATLWLWGTHSAPLSVFGGMFINDRFALFLDGVMLGAALVTIAVSSAYIERYHFAEAEFYAMALFSVTGMMILVHSGSLIMLVIGLETMSLALYAMVCAWTGSYKGAEAGLKYFLFGAVATALLLYGIALTYGVTGGTNLLAISRVVAEHGREPLLVVGMILILAAMSFKIALVPFHMWAPDAYEGAPTPVTGFMAAAVKVAGFGILVRLVKTLFASEALSFGSGGWVSTFWTLSVLTMTIGNISALRQRNIKRMLAYSSIAHAGYALIGVIAVGLTRGQESAVVFYLLSYALTTVGAFAVVAWLGEQGLESANLDDWAGLSKRHPAIALAMTVFMLSLGGVPPTIGFFAKFYVFRAALSDPQLISLVIIAVLNSVVSFYYYLRPVVVMYFRESTTTTTDPLERPSVYAAIAVAATLVLLLGLMPSLSLNWAELATLAH